MACSNYFTYASGHHVGWDAATQRLYPVPKEEVPRTIQEINELMQGFINNADRFDYFSQFWNYGTYIDIASLHCQNHSPQTDCFILTTNLLDSVRDASKRLLETSPPKEIKDRATVMYEAIATGDTETVKDCLKNGEPVDGVNQSGWHAGWPYLCSAAFLGSEEMVTLLLDSGATINLCTPRKSTALHLAAMENHLSTITTLVTRGADKTLLDEFGYTPLTHAQMAGHKEIVDSGLLS